LIDAFSSREPVSTPRQAGAGFRSKRCPGLKMPELGPYDRGDQGRGVMFRRALLLFCLIAMGLGLDGCTRCGPIWDDWVQSPKSCKSDRF
jgi:hypothetical protein